MKSVLRTIVVLGVVVCARASAQTEKPAKITMPTPRESPPATVQLSIGMPSPVVSSTSTVNRPGPDQQRKPAPMPIQPVPPQGGPRGGDGPRQGGDSCATAIVISGLPYTDWGTTIGYTDDYHPQSCGYARGAPDVVYTYTPPADIRVNVNLCGSIYDTTLYIRTNCEGGDLYCNDDSCGLQSEIDGVLMTAGVSYHIIVDGYESNAGSYVLTVSEAPLPPPNDNCEDVTPVTLILDGPPLTFTGTMLIEGCPCNSSIPEASHDFTTCADGNATVHFNDLVAGTYYIPVGMFPSSTGPYTIHLSAVTPPLPLGACCIGTECSVLTQAACDTAGGHYLDDGSTCDPNPCVPQETCVDPGLIHIVKCYTPLEWQPRLTLWNRDANGNFVEDDIDAMDPNSSIDVIVDLNRCPSATDLGRLQNYGVLGYVSEFLTVAHLQGVRVSDTPALAQDEAVAMVELNHEVTATLDVSTRAMRVRSSAEYSPNTVEDQYGLTGAGVGIAIIDTGVDDGIHESLPAGKFSGGFRVGVLPGYLWFWPIDGNPRDLNRHGTHVAGIALGTGGTSQTYRGVAPGASLIDGRVLGANGSGSVAGVIYGINRCIKRRVVWNVRVLNMSLGVNLVSNGLDALSQAANTAVREGIVVVVAAGNSGPGPYTVGIPAVADEVIAVAAADDANTVVRTDDSIAPFSSRGPRIDGTQKPDVAAPGVHVMSALRNTFLQYVELSGTSMAAPHVAGLAALILEQRPGMSARNVKDVILRTAQDFGPAGWDPQWGYGLVDGLAAVQWMAVGPTDLRFNDAGCCFSKDLYTVNPRIVANVPNTICARVTNAGASSASNFDVRIGVYGFGNGQADYPVCTVSVPGPLAPGVSTVVQCPWTPRVSGSGVVHACLKAEIVYPSDTNPANNRCQHNIDIRTAGARDGYRMEVLNPTDCWLDITLQATMQPPDAPWVFQPSEWSFRLEAVDPPRIVDMTLTPLDPNAPPVGVAIRAVGQGVLPDPLDLGGVMLFAQSNNVVDCNGNGIHDWIDLRSGTSLDCNNNGIPDECDIASGTSTDCDLSGAPDECQPEYTDTDVFVTQLLSDDPDPDLACMFDADQDGLLNGTDIQGFVNRLVTGG